MSIEVMRQALEELEADDSKLWPREKRTNAITTLRAAIEAAEKQEPVAWMGEYNINDIRDHYTVVMRHKTDFSSMPDRVRPLYTHPQPAIPEGWQLVPVEPTEAMLDAGEMIDGDGVTYVDLFKAMLPAAPKPENSHD